MSTEPTPAATPEVVLVPATPAIPPEAGNPFSIPTYAKLEGVAPPTDPRYYMVGTNGWFVRRDQGFMFGVVPSDPPPAVQAVEREIGVRFPALPSPIIWQAMTFCREVYKKHQSECILIPCWSKSANAFGLWCPMQKVSRSSIHEYDNNYQFKGDVVVIGTIHSHCDFSSFHSGTDEKDERYSDGLHVTLGNVNRDIFSVTASLAMGGYRLRVRPEAYFQGIAPAYGSSHMGQTDYRLTLNRAEHKAMERLHQGMIDYWVTRVQPHVYVTTYGGGTHYGTTYTGPHSVRSTPLSGIVTRTPMSSPSGTRVGVESSGTTTDDEHSERIRAAYQTRDRDHLEDPRAAYYRRIDPDQLPATGAPASAAEAASDSNAGTQLRAGEVEGECIPTGKILRGGTNRPPLGAGD